MSQLLPHQQSMQSEPLHVVTSNISPSSSDLNWFLETGKGSMSDLESWDFEPTTDYGTSSSLMDDIGFGLDLEAGLNQPIAYGLRIAGIDSDSDSDTESELESDFHGKPADFSSGVDDSGFAGFWDTLWDEQMEPDNPSEEFDSIIDGCENLEASVSSSLSSISAQEERTISMRDLEWEFLLRVNNYVNEIGDSFIFDAGYDAVSEESEDYEVVLRGGQPAAKKVVENLPLVALREKDLRDGIVVCAVCGDEVVEGHMANRLPCWHYYHGECIVPWLKIRNTCPVCRYELPIEDHDDERRTSGGRGETSGSSGSWREYSSEMFPSFWDLYFANRESFL